MGRKTPLFALHESLGARMVDFGGWDMPVQFTSQIAEHHAVRAAAGVFDVSHMGIVDLHGPRSRELLQHLLANDVGRLQTPGKALYSCMLNESAGVRDDLIVYLLGQAEDGAGATLRPGAAGAPDARYRLVVNAGTRERDLAWIRERAQPYGVEVVERPELAMLAVQGPKARAAVAQLLAPADAAAALALPTFSGTALGSWFVARTGYTGEDGFEVMMPAADAVPTWQRLNALEVVSCGLGARDTLRLEAGMNLYGNDMDERTHPYESGLAWTVALEPPQRDFVGRAALEPIARNGSPRQQVGLLLLERGVLRDHQRVATTAGAGEVTSGSYSPTLERSIALARVPAGCGDSVQVDIRGKLLAARVVKPPFVRHGKARIAL